MSDCKKWRERLTFKSFSKFIKFFFYFITITLIAIYCSEFSPLISKKGEYINSILTIFSLLNPIAMGILIEYCIRKTEIYSNAIQQFKRLQCLFWYSIPSLLLLVF